MGNDALPANAYSFMQTMARLVIEGSASASRSITYKRQTAETYSATAQTNTPTYSDTSLTALRHVASQEMLRGEQGAEPQTGLVVYQVEKRRLTNEPSSSDRVVDGSDTFEVLDHATDTAGLYWMIRCRKVAA
jgi:hypothetical protein